MDGLKKHKIKKITFGIIGLVIIPFYSYCFSLNGPKGDLILVTFSQIGARYGAIENLILWGILSSFFYFSIIDYMIYLSDTKIPILKVFLSLSCLSLLITVFLPFAPTMFPIASETHNLLAYVTTVAIILTLLTFLFSFWNRDRNLFYKSFFLLLVIILVLIFLFINYGVNSLFQIILSTSLCLYMFLELCFLEGSSKIDIYQKLKTEDEREEIEDLF